MPAHNAGRWLAEAVESVVSQTFSDFELIVVDDGSTDATSQILAGFKRRDPRIKVLRQPRKGLTAALNRGLAAARAPLLARLDADDVAHPSRLERQYETLEAKPAVGLLGSWAQEIDADGRPLRQRRPETHPEVLARLLTRSNPFVHSSIMARTELLRRLGGYRCAFEAAEDYDLWLRVAEHAKVANLPEALVKYRVHGASVSQLHGLRQAFSARLAQRAAQARRRQERDPTETLTALPDWRCPRSAEAFYARDAALYRWLERACDESVEGDDEGLAPCEALFDRSPGLSHAERQLAAQALISWMKSRDPARAHLANGLMLRLLWKRPAAVLRAVWALRPRPARQARMQGG
jgi:GT2 family glycosyltransferase